MDAKQSLETIKQWPVQVREYVGELQAEMKRVSWPSWIQVRATTLVVLGCTFGFAAYFAIVDLLIGRGITKLFDALTK